MIKYLLLTTALFFIIPLQAATVYISDQLRVPLRKSPCSTCSIKHRGLLAGTRLTVLSKNEDWTQVTTSGGLQGWVPNQYLVDQPIARDRLQRVEKNSAALKIKTSDLTTELSEFQKKYTRIEDEIRDLAAQRKTLEQELSTIKKISGNAITLQQQNEELIKRNRILQSEIDVLTASRDQLVKNDTQRWFIYGGLAVVLGAMLTILIPLLKPRRKFSEWN